MASYSDLNNEIDFSQFVTVLYKCVGPNLNSFHYNKLNQLFHYAIGSTPSCDDFKRNSRCGNGLHLCLSPIESYQYTGQRSSFGYRFLACPVLTSEINIIGNIGTYVNSTLCPFKVKVPRIVMPIWEVDVYGGAIYKDKTGRINKSIRGTGKYYISDHRISILNNLYHSDLAKFS